MESKWNEINSTLKFQLVSTKSSNILYILRHSEKRYLHLKIGLPPVLKAGSFGRLNFQKKFYKKEKNYI
jgi:hypothetical protein